MMAKIESSVKNEALKLRKSSEQNKKINRWTTCRGKNEELWIITQVAVEKAGLGEEENSRGDKINEPRLWARSLAGTFQNTRIKKRLKKQGLKKVS